MIPTSITIRGLGDGETPVIELVFDEYTATYRLDDPMLEAVLAEAFALESVS